MGNYIGILLVVSNDLPSPPYGVHACSYILVCLRFPKFVLSFPMVFTDVHNLPRPTPKPTGGRGCHPMVFYCSSMLFMFFYGFQPVPQPQPRGGEAVTLSPQPQHSHILWESFTPPPPPHPTHFSIIFIFTSFLLKSDSIPPYPQTYASG